MQRPPLVFLSNKMSKLADQLGSLLFSSQPGLFEKRLIVVGSHQIKSFLQLHFASDPKIGVSSGVEILTLDAALSQLSQKNFPSELELSFQIEYEMLLLLGRKQEMDRDERALFAPLFNYLDKERALPLSEQLAGIFKRYAIFGGQFLDSWEKRAGWMQALWHQVHLQFPLPYRDLKEASPASSPVHLFGFSFLPKLFVDFFNKLGACYYLLSPCSLFWGDLATDRERISIEKKAQKEGVRLKEREELRDYLKERPPLLANMGKAARKFLSFSEEAEVVEDYEQSSSPSRLHQLKDDLLMMESGFEKSPLEDSDRSIQLHAATSKWQEIEVLYNVILELSAKGELEPKDVLVLAPDIQPYLSFIHAVFGSKESLLDYAISGIGRMDESSFTPALAHLLSLPSHRFDKASILKLFTFPPFLKKWQLSEEEVAKVRKWVEKSAIRWGVDSEQRDSFLSMGKMLEETAQGTWQHGLDQLLFSLAEEESALSMTEAELLGKLSKIISSLREDLAPLSNGTELTFSHWISYIKCLAECMLSDPDEKFNDDLERLSSSLEHLSAPLFTYDSVERALKQLFEKRRGSFQPSHLNAVRFSSFSSGSPPPAKLIWLLGMEEDAFPRTEPLSSLCEMTTSRQADYFPSLGDEDRLRFLHALLAAEDYLIMSYERVGMDEEKGPSPVVTELFSTISGERLIFTHPFISFDATYFDEGAWPRSYSKSSFSACKAHQDSKAPRLFLPSWHVPHPIESKTETLLDIKNVMAAFKHPLQFYFNQTLGIYLKRKLEEHPELAYSALDHALISRRALKMPYTAALSIAEEEGKLPLGSFKQAATMRLLDQVQEMKSALSTFNLKEGAFFNVELNPHCTEPTRSAPDLWILPPLCVPLKEGQEVLLVGKLSDLSAEGWLYHGKDELEDLIVALPLFLIYLALPSFEGKGAPDLLLIESEKRVQSSFKEPLKLLSPLLSYVFLCKANPSPLLPEFAHALLKGDERDLHKALVLAKRALFPHPYLQWLLERDPLPSSSHLFESWAAPLRALFDPLLEGVQ
jgi:exodeoxyribonuclease V gamma subunit